jgi:hypothetical protein
MASFYIFWYGSCYVSTDSKKAAIANWRTRAVSSEDVWETERDGRWQYKGLCIEPDDPSFPPSNVVLPSPADDKSVTSKLDQDKTGAHETKSTEDRGPADGDSNALPTKWARADQTATSSTKSGSDWNLIPCHFASPLADRVGLDRGLFMWSRMEYAIRNQEMFAELKALLLSFDDLVF